MSICITVGHGKTTSGAYDPGAVYGDWHEHRLAREIAKYAADYYNDNYAEKCDLINFDSEIFLSERIRLINSGGYDFAAEIHLNSGGGTGVEVYRSVTADDKTAAAVSAEISREFGLYDRGAKVKKTYSGSDYYSIIRQTKIPTILIECLFLDNPEDLELIKQPVGQKKMGETIAKSIARIRGAQKKEKACRKSGSGVGAVCAEDLARQLKSAGFDAVVIIS